MAMEWNRNVVMIWKREPQNQPDRSFEHQMILLYSELFVHLVFLESAQACVVSHVENCMRLCALLKEPKRIRAFSNTYGHREA